tara:strand:+ start:890 stop:1720 length:831 start_codon:yes stop_codon:yes gene_type:complete
MELNLNTVGKHPTWSIMKRMYPIDVLTLCLTSEVFKKYCADDKLFLFLLNHHYLSYLDYVDSDFKTNKDKYLFLTDIISVNNLFNVKNKVKIGEKEFGIWLYDVVNIFDLLYKSTGNDHDFGAINDLFIEDIFLFDFYNLDFILNEVLSDLDYNIRTFLNMLKKKDQNCMEKLNEYFETEFKDNNEFDPNVETVTFEQFINNLLTLESRMENYISNKIDRNIMEKIQYDWDVDIDLVFYDKNEKLLLQIIHNNVQNGNLHIFDRLDQDIISKLINR